MAIECFCLCGLPQAYADCCGQYIDDKLPAPTAEALMRSRYSAFCRGSIEYLIQTHHPSQRSNNDAVSLTQSLKSTQWLGLTVLNTQRGGTKETKGTVEFVAAYQTKSLNPKIAQLHEISQFVKEEGQWYYVNGEILPPYRPKRSQPCWCGSGKKYKHCHG